MCNASSIKIKQMKASVLALLSVLWVSVNPKEAHFVKLHKE